MKLRRVIKLTQITFNVLGMLGTTFAEPPSFPMEPPITGAPATPPAPAESSPASIPAPLVPETTDKMISLNFQNTDIDLVLKFFSDVTKDIFVKSDLVRGFVTVVAPNRVPMSEAMLILQTVLEVKGFTMVQGPGKLVKVLTQSEAAQSELELGVGTGEISEGSANRMMTQVIPLKFVSAQDIKAEISPLMSKGGNLIADDRMNSLVMTDLTSNIRRLMKMIASLDTRTPQVLIEALMMEVSLTDETKLGVEWSHSSGFTTADHHFSGDTSQNFDVGSLISEGLKYSVIRDDLNFKALVQALATDQRVNILSTPHIMTLNNQPALIRVGEEVPVQTQSRNIQGGDTVLSYDYKNVAIELEVTPRINADREVHLKVHPSVKKVLAFNQELNAPILASREAETTVIIKDGQTVVIGGLMKDDQKSSQSKIPILGDIPLLGALFRSKSTTKEKTELLVFITPRVVMNSDEARDLTIHKEAEAKTSKTPYRMTALTHYRLAQMDYSEKRYKEALQELEQVIQLSPDEKLKRKAEHLSGKARKKMR